MIIKTWSHRIIATNVVVVAIGLVPTNLMLSVASTQIVIRLAH